MQVLYWDPSPIGHHRRYLDAVIEAMPDHLTLVAPSWVDADDLPHVDVVEQSATDEYGSLRTAMTETRVDAVVLGHGNELARRLATAPRPPSTPFVVIDLRCVPARRDVRYRADRLDGARAAAEISMREVAVRRMPIRYLSLIPDAVRGSDALRERSDWFPDPLQLLDHDPRSDGASDRVTISLVGVLAEKKGVADLAAAVAQLPQPIRDRVDVVFAGEPDDVGRAKLAEARAILDLPSLTTTVIERRLTDDELADVLAGSDVVALPYRSHQGGSGILGTALACTTAQVVISDFGWPGEVGRQLGAITYRNLDVDALSATLATAIDRGPRPKPLTPGEMWPFYGTHEDFGRSVWTNVARVLADG